jgi:hypothetical protein
MFDIMSKYSGFVLFMVHYFAKAPFCGFEGNVMVSDFALAKLYRTTAFPDLCSTKPHCRPEPIVTLSASP